jgi:hypothetical protein
MKRKESDLSWGRNFWYGDFWDVHEPLAWQKKKKKKVNISAALLRCSGDGTYLSTWTRISVHVGMPLCVFVCRYGSSCVACSSSSNTNSAATPTFSPKRRPKYYPNYYPNSPTRGQKRPRVPPYCQNLLIFRAFFYVFVQQQPKSNFLGGGGEGKGRGGNGYNQCN